MLLFFLVVVVFGLGGFWCLFDVVFVDLDLGGLVVG